VRLKKKTDFLEVFFRFSDVMMFFQSVWNILACDLRGCQIFLSYATDMGLTSLDLRQLLNNRLAICTAISSFRFTVL
jgi:hypothetical protein